MAKLYTKKGDKGYTTLYDMRNVSKTDNIFDCLGDLDELSAYIGVVCTVCTDSGIVCPKDFDFLSFLRNIQLKLLDLGSDIATIQKREKLTFINSEDVATLEKNIDFCQQNTPPLTEFLLPGYRVPDSFVHLCRTTSRRAERNMWKIKDKILAGEQSYIYMNRLSDFFFALSRYLSQGNEIKRSDAVKMA